MRRPPPSGQCQADLTARYNHRRPHWTFLPEGGGDPVTLYDVYVRGVKVGTVRPQLNDAVIRKEGMRIRLDIARSITRSPRPGARKLVKAQKARIKKLVRSME